MSNVEIMLRSLGVFGRIIILTLCHPALLSTARTNDGLAKGIPKKTRDGKSPHIQASPSGVDQLTWKIWHVSVSMFKAPAAELATGQRRSGQRDEKPQQRTGGSCDRCLVTSFFGGDKLFEARIAQHNRTMMSK